MSGSKPAENSVADVIGKRERGVANLRRERFDEISSNGAINHADVNDLEEHEKYQHRRIGVHSVFGRHAISGGGIDGHGGESGGAGHFIFCGTDTHNIVSRGTLHGLVDGDVGQHREKASRHHQPFAAHAIRERSKEREERHGQQQGDGDDDVCVLGGNFQNCLQVEKRIKLAGVPDHALTGGSAEQAKSARA